MFSFKPLASSSAGCCYLLGCGNLKPLLLDCGISWPRIQRGLDFKTYDVAGCLVSHAHGDHSASVRKLLENAIDVYMSQEAWASPLINQIAWNDQKPFTAHHRAHIVEPHKEFRVGQWTVMPFDACHDEPGTLGFVCAAGSIKVLYLTDSAWSRYKFEGLTHLLIECNYAHDLIRGQVGSKVVSRERYRRTTSSHMSLERLVEMLKANDLSQCQEIHLLHLSDDNSDEERFAREVREATGIPTFVAPRAVV